MKRYALDIIIGLIGLIFFITDVSSLAIRLHAIARAHYLNVGLGISCIVADSAMDSGELKFGGLLPLLRKAIVSGHGTARSTPNIMPHTAAGRRGHYSTLIARSLIPGPSQPCPVADATDTARARPHAIAYT